MHVWQHTLLIHAFGVQLLVDLCMASVDYIEFQAK